MSEFAVVHVTRRIAERMRRTGCHVECVGAEYVVTCPTCTERQRYPVDLRGGETLTPFLHDRGCITFAQTKRRLS
jgi:hypothetical protein